MRPLSIISILFSTLLITSFLILLVPKQVYAGHCGAGPGCVSGNFVDECYLESNPGGGNCEDASVPTGCAHGNTGASCCADYQDFYSASIPGITVSCANVCSYTFASPNVQPRSGPVCPVIGSEGGLQSFCCTYFLPTPTPTPTNL